MGPWNILPRSKVDRCTRASQRPGTTPTSRRTVPQMPKQQKTTFPRVQAKGITKGYSRPAGATSTGRRTSHSA